MKRTNATTASRGAFTTVEMAVGVGVLGLLGMVFFSVLNSGMVLFAKNTAVNVAHEEGRQGVNRLTRDIHAAVSVPELRNASYTAVSTNPVNGVSPTAAGVSFQVVSGGPHFVWQDPAGNSLIMINDGIFTPVPGQRLLVPFWGVEGNIIKRSGASVVSHSNVWLDNDRQTYVGSKGPPYREAKDYTPSTVFAITYYTERVMYVVENGSYVADPQGMWRLSGGNYVPAGSYVAAANGEFVLFRGAFKPWSSGSTGQRYNYVVAPGVQRLRYENGDLNVYFQRYTATNANTGTFFWQRQGTVAKYISTPQPFYVPAIGTTGVDSKFVGVSLSTRDPKSSNRGYLATSSLLDTEIDYRSRIALYQ